MPDVRFIVSHGVGHYEVTLGDYCLSCDEGELKETIAEIKEMVEAA